MGKLGPLCAWVLESRMVGVQQLLVRMSWSPGTLAAPSSLPSLICVIPEGAKAESGHPSQWLSCLGFSS